MTLTAYVRRLLAPLCTERSLHVCALCAFAVSEPLFAFLKQRFVFLHDLNVGWIEICYLVLLTALLPPLVCILLDMAVVSLSTRWWGGRGRNAFLGMLMCLLWLCLVRPFIRWEFLELNSIMWMVSLTVAIGGAIGTLYVYQRSLWFRRWVSLATVGLVLFPGQFVIAYASLGKPVQHAPATIANPVPVVMIVFDEFSGTSLMNGDLQIDEKNFPQFARLGKMATWYRQASTVHIRTDVAVPAMLSSQYPTVKRPPLESEFPGNLFRIVNATQAYDMTIFEPITRLAPESLRRRPKVQRTTWQKLSLLTSSMVAIYPRLILPGDTPLEFPPLSKMWFGISEDLTKPASMKDGLCHFEPFSQRDYQLDQFMLSLRPTDRPLFNFMHVELPHLPWCYLPSGRRYDYNESDSFHPAGSWGDIGEDWGNDATAIARNEHRYLLQLGYVDRFLGHLLDRLEEIGILDQCLLIVTADHGVSFVPGHSRRVPDAATLPYILSVPLFIKLPGQKAGGVSDSNVESIDILPTIAEVLGIELLQPPDGIAVSQEKRRSRKSLFLEEQSTIVEPEIPRLSAAVQRRLSIFGADSLERPPVSASTHAAWHGRPVGEFAVDDLPLKSLVVDRNITWTFPRTDNPLLALVAGTFDLREVGVASADLVVAVNGIVRDSGPSFQKGKSLHGFEFLLPESDADQNPLVIEIFQVMEPHGSRPHLRRLGSWDQRRVRNYE